MPTITILMTTYNGERWLDEQLESIASQTDVAVRVVVSDDHSRDGTRDILEGWRSRLDLTVLPSGSERFGNAHRNFMRLVREAPVLDSEYVAFCDQDDIWETEKLSRAVSRLQKAGADAYSSDVTAFWEGGLERRIVKSQPLQALDHLFESGGPGCTFVLTRKAFLSLRDWATLNRVGLDRGRVHDWHIYAFGREQGWIWNIDAFPGLRYRQHRSNEIGANVGLKSALHRLKYLRSGQYRQDVLRVAILAGHHSSDLDRLMRLGWRDRIALAFGARRFRRKASDAIVVAGAFLIMKREAFDPVPDPIGGTPET